MKKYILLTTALVMGAMLFAQPGQERDRGQRGNTDRRSSGPEMLMERLDLNDDQKEKMETLRISHFRSVQETKNELKIKHAQLNAEVTTDVPDQQKIDKLVNDITGLTGQLFAAGVAHRMEVRAILTNKQKVRFDQIPNHQGMSGPQRGRKARILIKK